MDVGGVGVFEMEHFSVHGLSHLRLVVGGLADVAEVEGVHGIAAEAGDVGVGEMEDLVVVEDDDGGLLHDEGIHLAVELKATEVVGLLLGAGVEAVEFGAGEVGVVGAGGRMVGGVEEREIVFGVGVVGDPAAAEPRTFALSHLLAEGSRRVDVDLDLDTEEAELLLDVAAEVEVGAGGREGDGREALAVGIACLGEETAGASGIVAIAVGTDGVEARKAHGYEAAGAWGADAVAS